MSVSEMETVQGIPTGRLAWPKAIARTKYSGMIGNAFTAGVIGRVALQYSGETAIILPEYWAMQQN